MAYQCQRCGYTSAQKQGLIRHLTRKNVCRDVLMDIDVKVLLDECIKKVYGENHVECSQCSKKFNNRSSMQRHKRSCIKPSEKNHDSDNFQFIKSQLQVLTDRMATFEDTCPRVVQENCNNNIQVNVVNGFGREDTSHLTTQFLDRCVRKTNAGLIDLLDKLHFGGDHGCNANVRITNRKLPLAEVNDGSQWKFVKKDKAINDMVDRGQDILQEHLDEHQERIKEQLSESMWQHIQEYFERMEVRDEATIRDILDDVYIMLLNKTRELTHC